MKKYKRKLKRLRGFYNRQKSNIKAITLTVSRMADYREFDLLDGVF